MSVQVPTDSANNQLVLFQSTPMQVEHPVPDLPNPEIVPPIVPGKREYEYVLASLPVSEHTCLTFRGIGAYYCMALQVAERR